MSANWWKKPWGFEARGVYIYPVVGVSDPENKELASRDHKTVSQYPGVWREWYLDDLGNPLDGPSLLSRKAQVREDLI